MECQEVLSLFYGVPSMDEQVILNVDYLGHLFTFFMLEWNLEVRHILIKFW